MAISDLPDDILSGYIFGKLPLWSQLEAKAVCKHWKTLLSSCKIRAKEGWIIANCLDHLLCYNVVQNRWLKKSIASLPRPLHSARLCCVSEEHFFFRGSGALWRWNAATDEIHQLNLHPVSGKVRRYEAYTDERSGELKLLLHACNASGWRLFRGDVESGGAWEEWPFQGILNNLMLVTISHGNLLHTYNVGGERLETLNYTPEEPKSSPFRRFFVFGESKFCVEPAGIRVLWYNPGTREFVVVSRVAEEVARSMVEERGGVVDGGRHYLYCSDGVENIWILLPGCSKMLRFNVVSRAWFTLPSALATRRLDNPTDHDPLVTLLYTTF